MGHNLETMKPEENCWEANLGLKNYRETPMMHIALDIMEEFLDDWLKIEGLTTDDKLKITFKYHFHGSPRMWKFSIDEFKKEMSDESKKELPETEPRWYISQIKEHG